MREQLKNHEYIFSTDDMYAVEMRRFDELTELIRCKDCRFYTGKWCTRYSTKQFDVNDICKGADDYCSAAERKEE